MEGILKFQGKGWKDLKVTLDGSNFFVTKKGKEKKILDIDLTTVSSVEKDEDAKKPNSFTIEGEKNYTFSCPSEEEQDNWVSALKKAMSPDKHEDANDSISLEDFEILNVLGKGGYGKVQLVRYKGNGEIYAMKSMSKSELADEGLISRTMDERKALLSIQHPFIVSARYAFQTSSKVFLVTDYVPGGELYTRMRSERKFSLDRIRYYSAMLVSAIGYLHSIGIVHRDLKPENILIDKDGYLKLTDFGFVKVGMQSSSYTTTFCGTDDYIAPEIIKGEAYNKSVDWWSLGILIYEMVFLKPPFSNPNQSLLYNSIVNDEVTFPEEIDPDLADLIQKLLNKIPEERIGAGFLDCASLIEHPFFDSVDFDELEEKKIEMEWKPTLQNELDVSQFDVQFTRESPAMTPDNSANISSSVQQAFVGFTFKNDF